MSIEEDPDEPDCFVGDDEKWGDSFTRNGNRRGKRALLKNKQRFIASGKGYTQSLVNAASHAADKSFAYRKIYYGCQLYMLTSRRIL